MKKIIAPLAVLLVGAVGIAALALSRKPPAMLPVAETSQKVEGIVVQTMTVVPRITTYGEVKPDRTWTAVAQVAGKVVWKSPKLKNGEFIGEGEELVRLDDREFKLAITKALAEVDRHEANLTELKTNYVNMNRQLDLLREAVSYNERELERQQNLHDSRAVSASAVEQHRITVLEQQRTLSSLQAEYEAMPSQINSQIAQLDSAVAAYRQAELDLEHTTIKAPFTGRLDEVSVEISQYLPVGQTFLKLDSIAEAEVTIGASAAKLAMLAGTGVDKVAEAMAGGAERPAQPHSRFRVLADNGNGGVEWEGKFGRMSASVDPATRMVEMVITVDNPYPKPGSGARVRPPLSKGTFCTVIVYGQRQPERPVVPRMALREGAAYVATPESRLEIREVSVVYYLDKYAVIQSGLTPGETVVTSDILPAVPGMLLDVKPRDGFYEDAIGTIGEEADA